MERLNDLELAVMAKLLAGDHPVLAALRQQLRKASASARRLTGVGFFTDLDVPASAPRAQVAPGRVHVGDVEAQIEGLRSGAGFVLFVEDGYLRTLEGYTYDEPWPASVGRVALTYTSPGGRDLKSLLS